MANFIKALTYTLKHEGGWSNHPADKGGATNFGITFKVAQRHGIKTVAALKSITQEQVAAIYRADYWRFDGINDQAIATKIFDMAVNKGLAAGVRIAQKAIQRATPGIRIDGKYGPVTEAAINAHDPKKLMAALCSEAEAFYRAIIAKNPSQKVFEKGWMRRAVSVPSDQ